MAQLGSSPLGLVMNTGRGSQPKIGSYVLGESENGRQLFNSIFGRNNDEVSTHQFAYSIDESSTFDIKTQDIIEYCQNYPLMKLTYADFAYLKNLGVYPNNRLIIARRFAAPVGDDLINNTDNNTYPLATLISWVPDNEDFFSVKFGEVWTEGDVTFETVLNEAAENSDILGGDNLGKKLGTFLTEGAGIVPLQGWSEGIQYEIFRKLGLTDLKSDELPFGNPSLIRKSKRRAVASKDDAFEGVTTTFQVKMTIEYEQKFISGIDPTGVYYDIIANALSFGTSVSKFMFKPESLGANNQFAVFLNNLGSGNINRIGDALRSFMEAISSALQAVAKSITDTITGLWQGKDNETKEKEQASKDEGGFISKAVDLFSTAASAVGKALQKLIETVVAGVISKYKVRIISILDALTGSPSTPWHVSIGNPKRPILSSGDMLVDSVDVKFGKLLAYNDLPSSITLDITLTNSRGLGSQEIYKKLNCGRERTYKIIRKDILSVDSELNISVKVPPAEEITQKVLNSNNSAGQGAPVDNSGNANRNRPNITNGTTECFKSHNYIFQQIVEVLALRDSYGFEDGKKVPLLKNSWKGFFGNDNEIAAENSIRVELVSRKLSEYVSSASKCPNVKTVLENNLKNIYDGIKRGSNSVVIDYYDPASIGSTSGSATLIKKSINCDFKYLGGPLT